MSKYMLRGLILAAAFATPAISFAACPGAPAPEPWLNVKKCPGAPAPEPW